MTRILVIEDSPDTLALLKQALSFEGFDVLTADNGPQGLCAFLNAWIENKPVGAVILDCAMAPMDGFTAAKSIRLWEANSRYLQPIKMAFYTAYPETVESTTLLKDVGADRYFRKPNDADKLPQLVVEWLRGKPHEKAQDLPQRGYR